MKLKLRITSIALSVLFAVGCVKLEVKDVVSDTVDAGKGLYTSAKRKRNGEEQKVYSYALPSESEELDIENMQKCKEQVIEMITVSGHELRKILAEESQLSLDSETRIIKCRLTVLVALSPEQ